MNYSILTNDELLRLARVATPLETELLTRLGKMMYELERAIGENYDARRASESRSQALAQGQGNLALLPSE